MDIAQCLFPMGQPVRRNYAVSYRVTITLKFVFTHSRAVFMAFVIMVRLKELRSASVYTIPSDRGARCQVLLDNDETSARPCPLRTAKIYWRRSSSKSALCFALRFFCIVLMSAYQASPREYMLRFVMRSKSIPQKVLGEESTSNTPHDFGCNITA